KYIRYHSAFVDGMRTPKIDENSDFWERYLNKYFTYAAMENEEKVINAKDRFFTELKEKIEKGSILANSKEDVKRIITANLKTAKNAVIVDNLAEEFWNWWKEETSKELYNRIHLLSSGTDLDTALTGG
ncbi:MAG: hypothetical protein ACP5LI_07930, partial [Hydrogenobaculum sp.]